MAADVADAYCEGELRLTVDQKILFPNVDTAKVPEMTETMPFFKRFPVVSGAVLPGCAPSVCSLLLMLMLMLLLLLLL